MGEIRIAVIQITQPGPQTSKIAHSGGKIGKPVAKGVVLEIGEADNVGLPHLTDRDGDVIDLAGAGAIEKAIIVGPATIGSKPEQHVHIGAFDQLGRQVRHTVAHCISALAIPRLDIKVPQGALDFGAQVGIIVAGLGVVLQRGDHIHSGADGRVGHRRPIGNQVVPAVAVATDRIQGIVAGLDADVTTPGRQIGDHSLVVVADLPMGHRRLRLVDGDPTVPAILEVADVRRSRTGRAHQQDGIAGGFAE